ncbi:MAG: hypothetical protein JSV76_05695 [Candidatus Bathyarchaeota archaeon]|nr:MAG: hypothetical protein JSV76_05695 [Candidatus Bathyarchaeota archaeon]
MTHLQSIGINATLLESGSPEAIGPMWNFGPINSGTVVGCIRIEDHNLDLIQVERMLRSEGHQDEIPDYHYLFAYHYVVKTNVETHEKTLKANVKPITKGLFRRKVIDFRWEGGDLARTLNADTDLRNMLLRDGLDQLPRIEIQLDRTNHCIRITQQFQISTGQSSRFSIGIGGFSVGTGGRPHDLDVATVETTYPSRETVELYNHIAHHIRSIINR